MKCPRRFFPAPFLLGLLLLVPAFAGELDRQYLRIITLLDQAEDFQKTGKIDASRTRYQEAQKALLEIKKEDNAWNPSMVSHRLKEISAHIAGLNEAAANASGAGSNSVAATKTSAAGNPVRLLDAGFGPRQTLRLKPVAGSKQSFHLILQSSMEIKAAGAEQTVETPSMTMSGELTVDEVTPDGDIRFTVVFGEGSMEEGAAELEAAFKMQRATLKLAKGFAVKLHVGDRGSERSPAQFPPDAPVQLKQETAKFLEALSDFSAEFPEEPVGNGAKWERKRTALEQGMSVNKTAIFELLELKDNVARVKILHTDTASNQKISNPALPGMKMDLENLHAVAEGESAWNLSRLAGTSGTRSGRGDMRISLNVGGQKQTTDMKLTSQARIETN